MGEKRFEINYGTIWIVDEEGEEELWNPQIVKILNKQQSIIDEQNQRIRKLEDILKKLQFPVERVGVQDRVLKEIGE